VQRISVSLPGELVERLDALAGRLGFTRSALVGQLLDAPVADILRMLGDLPLEPTDGDVRRFRGESAELLEATMRQVMAELEDFKQGEGEQ